MAKLSPHFNLEEFTRNSRGVENRPAPAVVERLRWMCVFVLEPLREHFSSQPIKITSGYRSPELNALVGGAPKSAHMAEDGRCAADIQPGKGEYGKVPLSDLFNWLAFESNIPFDTIILERGREERHEWDDCIHIQISPTSRRRKMVGATHGASGYTHVVKRIA